MGSSAAVPEATVKQEHTTTESTAGAGVSFPRYFTSRLPAGKTPYDEIRWELRTATIANDKGAVIFEQRDIEVPADWSQTATNIVASK
jgi:ribonucleoside-diphosphate reductase alpha chain